MEVDTTPAASGVAGGVGPPSSGGGESDVPVKPPAARMMGVCVGVCVCRWVVALLCCSHCSHRVHDT